MFCCKKYDPVQYSKNQKIFVFISLQCFLFYVITIVKKYKKDQGMKYTITNNAIKFKSMFQCMFYKL